MSMRKMPGILSVSIPLVYQNDVRDDQKRGGQRIVFCASYYAKFIEDPAKNTYLYAFPRIPYLMQDL
jgi:hypothetical protein